MSLEKHLRDQRSRGRKLLVPYVTGMVTDDWLHLVEAFAHEGADAIEVGLPFSDPAMDGPTIQAASTAALARGATPGAILSALRTLDIDVPIVVMTYANVVFRAGLERFAATLADSGVSGAIIPDLPLEESSGWERIAEDHGVATVLLAAPVTPNDRLSQIAHRSRGFVYAVSTMGVTGARASVPATAAQLAHRLKAVTDSPVLIGFGVSTPVQARELSTASDGVIVASALMASVLADRPLSETAGLVKDMREALDA